MITGTPHPRSSSGETRKEARHYFRYCPDLDLWSVGRTRAEAEARLREEIGSLLARCSKYDDPGTLHDECPYETYEKTP
jgi:predicted RNase H-like HicB family nuclease